MFRRLAQSYMKVRTFPRLVIQMLTNISRGVANLQAASAMQAASTNSALIDRTSELVDRSLDGIRSELSSFCDDLTRYVMRSERVAADHAARLAALHRALQMIEHSTVAAEKAAQQRLDDVRQEIGKLRAEIADVLRGNAAEIGRIEPMRLEIGKLRSEMVEALRGQSAEISRIERLTAQQARLYPTMLWAPETASRVRGILALLKPMDVQGIDKVRLGRDHDGGYIMLDDFADIGGALSLGIADDVSWDLDVAARGIDVFQFDPSVSGPPVANERFHFEPLRIVPEDVEDGISLGTIVDGRVGKTQAPLLLKIDIEGGEWDVFQSLDDVVLRRFQQIVCEFHDLDRLVEVDFGNRARDVFAKLTKFHAVIHVHGNNCGNFANVGNVVVPQALEVSFALRSAYRLIAANTSFPTPLDQPNQPGRADLFIGQFRFEDEQAAK